MALEEARHQRETLLQGQGRDDNANAGRKGLYLRYLRTIDEIVHLPTGDSATADMLAGHWSAFLQADNELELGGSEAVRKNSYPLFALLGKIIYRYSEILEDDDSIWPDDASAYMRSVEEEFRAARQTTISLMRDDLRAK